MKKTYIGSLDVTCRFKHNCGNSRVETLEQLAELSRSDVLRWGNCGKTTVNEMAVVLEQHGLAFKGEKFWGGKAVANRKIIQIVMGERDDVDSTEEYDPNGNLISGTSTAVKRSTLFALTNDGQIWTRAYHGGRYQEWFTVHTKDITEDR
jgi:hypothetical protein|tara:strand:+ start:832 stop:1281 length:450 start_codon:yes stop_codon:yes gene_type:complete